MYYKYLSLEVCLACSTPDCETYLYAGIHRGPCTLPCLGEGYNDIKTAMYFTSTQDYTLVSVQNKYKKLSSY